MSMFRNRSNSSNQRVSSCSALARNAARKPGLCGGPVAFPVCWLDLQNGHAKGIGQRFMLPDFLSYSILKPHLARMPDACGKRCSLWELCE